MKFYRRIQLKKLIQAKMLVGHVQFGQLYIFIFVSYICKVSEVGERRNNTVSLHMHYIHVYRHSSSQRLD